MAANEIRIEFEKLKFNKQLMDPEEYLKSLKNLKSRLNRSREFQTTKEQDQKIKDLFQ